MSLQLLCAWTFKRKRDEESVERDESDGASALDAAELPGPPPWNSPNWSPHVALLSSGEVFVFANFANVFSRIWQIIIHFQHYSLSLARGFVCIGEPSRGNNDLSGEADTLWPYPTLATRSAGGAVQCIRCTTRCWRGVCAKNEPTLLGRFICKILW